jgi:membrane protease subunit HflK
MDRVDRVAVDRLQSITVGFQDEEGSEDAIPSGQMLTGDHNLVNVQAVLTYKVRPNQEVEFVLQVDRIDALLNRAAEAGMSEWLAGRRVDDVLLNGKNELRLFLRDQTQKWIESYNLGVRILDVRVSLISPPDEVKPAFDSVALAQTRNRTMRNTAEQTVAREFQKAEAERYRLEQETFAYMKTRKLSAQQDAERFIKRLREYEIGRKNNPQYLRQIWEEERSKLFAQLKRNGQIDLLDHHLSADGLDVITSPPRKK